MPTKKKAATKARSTSRPSPQRAATRPTSAQQLAANTVQIQVLTICFTLLCIVFAIEAFWRYYG